MLLGLRVLREEFGYPRAYVADNVGLNPTTLWRLETGKTGATYQTADDLAKFFNTSIESLQKNTQECAI